MDNTEVPSLLFKYMALNDKNDLAHLLLMLSENQIYLPDYSQLNDPLEGASAAIDLGVCGQFITSCADEEYYLVKEAKSKFKIISFSSSFNSPQLWAHYGGNYSGVCLGFSTTGIFHDVRKVIYTEHKPSTKSFPNGEGLDVALLENFLHKEEHWSYEKEWRYIEKTDSKFLKYQKEDIKCILLGNRIEPDIKKLILQALLDYRIPVLKTHIGVESYKIRLLPMEYVHIYEGSTPPFVDDLDSYCR